MQILVLLPLLALMPLTALSGDSHTDLAKLLKANREYVEFPEAKPKNYEDISVESYVRKFSDPCLKDFAPCSNHVHCCGAKKQICHRVAKACFSSFDDPVVLVDDKPDPVRPKIKDLLELEDYNENSQPAYFFPY